MRKLAIFPVICISYFSCKKYAAVNGATSAVKEFRKIHPHLTFGESIVQKLRDPYKNTNKQKRAVDNKIPRLKHGTPLLLGAVLDQLVKHV